MRSATNVFPFRLTSRKLRPAKAPLRSETRAGVRQIIALAPILGQVDPLGVATIVEAMRNLIDPSNPDPDERSPLRRHGRLTTHQRLRERRIGEARAAIKSASFWIESINQLLVVRKPKV